MELTSRASAIGVRYLPHRFRGALAPSRCALLESGRSDVRRGKPQGGDAKFSVQSSRVAGGIMLVLRGELDLRTASVAEEALADTE